MISDTLKKKLRHEVVSQLDLVESLYKHFHANPELSCQEVETAARVAKEMEALGLEVHTGIGGHGVVAILDNGPGPLLLIRADMDALPLSERTGLSYASTVTGNDPQGNEVSVMHGCGHDLHTANLIGTAAVMVNLRESWSGRILFIAQPAEETIGGADQMVKDGIYDRFGRPDNCLALHVDPFVAAGSVSFSAGVQSSCNHAADLRVKGIGGHGASPHQTKDPIVIAAQIIMALQTLVSREVNPREMGIVTVGSIHGGTKRNIIPEEVELTLTIRAYTMEVADQLLEGVKRIADGVAASHGLPEELWPEITMPENSFLPVVNDPELSATIHQTFSDLLGPDNVSESKPATGSEDFGFFGNDDPPIPLVMYKLGVTDKQRLEDMDNGGEAVPPVHDPRFCPDLHPTLETALLTMGGAALRLLGRTS